MALMTNDQGPDLMSFDDNVMFTGTAAKQGFDGLSIGMECASEWDQQRMNSPSSSSEWPQTVVPENPFDLFDSPASTNGQSMNQSSEDQPTTIQHNPKRASEGPLHPTPARAEQYHYVSDEEDAMKAYHQGMKGDHRSLRSWEFGASRRKSKDSEKEKVKAVHKERAAAEKEEVKKQRPKELKHMTVAKLFVLVATGKF
jgi:hypothetical protein